MHADVIVVGGGIIGLFTAWALVEQGAKVTVFECGSVGREASWAGAGILSPLQPWTEPPELSPLTRWGQQRYPQLSAMLLEQTGIDPEWTASGLMALGTATVNSALGWAERHTPHFEVLDATAVSSCEPALAVHADDKALRLDHVAQIRNPRLLRALRIHLDQSGVTLREQTRVQRILVERDRVSGLLTTVGERCSSPKIVIAAGAWSAALLTEFGSAPAATPVRGQMLLYQTDPKLLQHIVLDSPYYLVPRRDGHVLVGSTVEYVGYDKSTTPAAGAELSAFAGRRLPALATQSPIGHWAGLRPGSTGLPTISQHPTIQGLYANTGHFRNGVTLAPASAYLLQNLITGEAPIVPADPYEWPTLCG